MKITGFTFIRNALKYDYPVVESIRSILPVCDEFVVAVGKSSDDTLSLINNIDKEKIKVIETVWDDNLREGGRVLADETNKAFRGISKDTDWCFYIQGDEVVHEMYLDTIYQGMQDFKDNDRVDGLLFNYLHFFGSYDYIGESYRWYRREIRVVRNMKSIYSYRDAQGFRKGDNEKLRVKHIDAYIYHYGWVKEPRAMQQKQEDISKYWHTDEWIDRNVVKASEFNYDSVDALSAFCGTHPEVMKGRIRQKNWKFDFDISRNRISRKERLIRTVVKLTGYRFGEYRNYKII
jgi:hypothetical protein